MSRQFVVITEDGSKWLRPVNPLDNNDPRFTSKEPFCILGMRPCSKTVCECDEWKKFEKNNPILPYIGSHLEGTILDESEVREVRQWRNKNISSLTWWDIPDGKDAQWFFVNNTDYLETRTAYTDAESHDMHITDTMGTEEQLAYKSLEEIHKHTTLCANDDEENLFVVGFIYGLRQGKSHGRHISGWTHVSDALPEHLETVWLSNGKGFTTLGCLVWTEDGWHWAATNGVIYEENGRIVSECESDDIDAEYWHRLPDALRIDKEVKK